MPLPVHAIAEQQWRDYRAGRPGTWFAAPGPAITLPDAYAVQDAVTRLRVQAGDVAVGYKVGCTGPGTTAQFGMTGPISGRLFRSELRPTGVVIEAQAHANLAIEGEMAVRIGPDGEPAEMLPIIELHNFVFRQQTKTLAELVTNNGLHAGIVLPLSPWSMPIDNAACVMTVRIGGIIQGEGNAWPHGDGPQSSLAWLRGHLASRGMALSPGDLVLTGTPLGLYAVQSGDSVSVAVNGAVAVTCTVN